MDQHLTSSCISRFYSTADSMRIQGWRQSARQNRCVPHRLKLASFSQSTDHTRHVSATAFVAAAGFFFTPQNKFMRIATQNAIGALPPPFLYLVVHHWGGGEGTKSDWQPRRIHTKGRIGYRPEFSGRIAIHFNGNLLRLGQMPIRLQCGWAFLSVFPPFQG